MKRWLIILFCLAAFLMCNCCGPDVRSETSVSDPSDNIGSAGQELSSGQSSSSEPVQSSEVSSDLNSELPVAAVRNTPLQKDEAVMNVRISELPGEDPFHVALGAAPDPFVTFCANRLLLRLIYAEQLYKDPQKQNTGRFV